MKGSPVFVVMFLGACASGGKPGDYTERVPGMHVGQTVPLEMAGIPGDGAIRPFWIGRTEITWNQYADFCFAMELATRKEAPGWTDQSWIKFMDEDRWCLDEVDAISVPSGSYEPHDNQWGFDDRPAIRLTRRNATEYCKWLSRLTGRTYRLPTEQEWEHACAAAPEGAGLADVAWFQQNSGGRTHPVRQRKPNAWGLYDMQGNVMEYVEDAAEPPTDAPWFEDHRPRAILKGGSWQDSAAALAPGGRRLEELAWSARNPNRPRSICWIGDGNFIGFRIARSQE